MRTLIIDGNNLCYRALVIRGSRESFGIAEEFKQYQKEVVLSVINGFLVQLLKLSQRYNTNQFIFAWDIKPYHRTELFPGYKSNRATTGRAKHESRESDNQWGPPPHLKEPTFRLIREKILPKLGFRNIFWKPGFEADDIIASIVQTYSKNISRHSTIVVSSDKDLWQLLDHCTIYSPKKGVMSKERFMSEYPFSPNVWPLFRALTGDTSDSIPGISLVGPVQATKFLTKNMTKTGKIYSRIVSDEGKKLVRRNLRLMTLPWPGTGVFFLTPDKLSFPALVSIAKKLSFRQILTHKEEWREFFK